MAEAGPKGAKNFFASCPQHLEVFLKNELESLGAQSVSTGKGGVHFKADHYTAISIALQSRIASRVYLQITTFYAANIDEVYDQTRNQWWHKIISVQKTFMITTLFDAEAKYYFNNSMHFSLKVKDAIADQIREKKGNRPDVSTTDPDYSFLVRVEENEKNKKYRDFFIQIYLDIAGDVLSNRGLRSSPHIAPLRENLAAALVLATKWNPQNEIFVDMMCGTGTAILEAAMIAANAAPSWFKCLYHISQKQQQQKGPWHFLRHYWYEEIEGVKIKTEKLFEQLVLTAEKGLSDLPNGLLLGNDFDTMYIREAQQAAEILGIKNKIEWTKSDATTMTLPSSFQEKAGVIFCNPPYGQRMETDDLPKLKEMYHQLGENLKNNFKGKRAYILTSNPELRKSISLRTSERIPAKNGNLECRLLRYDLH